MQCQPLPARHRLITVDRTGGGASDNWGNPNEMRHAMNRMSIMGTSIALLVFSFATHPAIAHNSKHHHHRHHHAYQNAAVTPAPENFCVFTNEGRQICGSYRETRRADRPESRVRSAADGGTIIGSRPAGCPHAYCGCGLRKYLALTDTRLNLARNWARLFPHEPSPRVGLAAVRNHHVMYIEAPASDGSWLVRDYNSGNGLSRIHVRDVSGYVFVNPHVRLASR
jgi:hypothetical protein